jgi:DNA polymerase III delta prime subunit
MCFVFTCMSKIPWVESYRPNDFNDIVMDDQNKQLLNNIILTTIFPNLLFYGPPGTGKTTTILNLIAAYQSITNTKNKGLVTHLNASDERGIDVIRNQINYFVNSKPLFNDGLKFVILDEVDYMTKNAQQALKYLLQSYSGNVRFCLICNYISKIDDGVQHEFVKLRFNQLPKQQIVDFLKKISIKECLNLDDDLLISIQTKFHSDIRSMINYMQSNQDILKNPDMSLKIINYTIWEEIITKIVNCDLDEVNIYIYHISINYNVDKKNIIKDLINYIIRVKQQIISREFLNFVENLIHSNSSNNPIYVNYSLLQLRSFLQAL